LIPEHLRPRGLMKVEGKVTDPNGAPVPAYISVLDRATKKRVFSGRPLPDGSYFFYLPEGARYELAINPEQSNMTFFAKSINLTTEKIPQREKVNVVLKIPASGDEMILDLVEFKPATAELTPFSDEELKRLARLIKATTGNTFEIQVLLKGYKESTEAYDPDLSETREEIQKELISADTTSIPSDTTAVSTDSSAYQPIDQYQETRIIYYHNDRTRKQADAIVEALTRAGVNASALTTVVNAIPAEGTESELTIKVVVR
jgi:hypothetical protein